METHQRVRIIQNSDLDDLAIPEGRPVTPKRATAIPTEVRSNLVSCIGFLRDLFRLARGYGEAITGHDDVRGVGGASDLAAVAAMAKRFGLNIAGIPDASGSAEATSVRHAGLVFRESIVDWLWDGTRVLIGRRYGVLGSEETP